MRTARSERLRLFTCAAIALAVVAIGTVAGNVLVERCFPELSRFTQDFSAAYLRREMVKLASEPSQTIFLGDSLMWGWGVHDNETTVALLTSQGCACKNLAITLGSPTNEYAVLRMLQAERVRPKAIVLEVNQVLFKPTVLNYANLREQVYDVTKNYLTADDLRLFPKPRRRIRRTIDQLLGSVSSVYAFHSDAREGVFEGEPEEKPLKPTFERLYSYAPLDEHNTGVRYVERILDLARAAGTPVYAFFTPTNHRAFGTKLDDPRFAANTTYLERLLRAHGATVLRLESRFTGDDFFDNIHLNAAGHRKLANLLAVDVPVLQLAGRVSREQRLSSTAPLR